MTILFFKLANSQSRRQATHKMGWQPGVCIWSLQYSSGVWVGIYGLTYSLMTLGICSDDEGEIFKKLWINADKLTSEIFVSLQYRSILLSVLYDTIWYKFLRSLACGLPKLTFKVLNFWTFTSYSSLKPLWSGMGEVVPARTSPTLHPPSPPTVHQLSWLALLELTPPVYRMCHIGSRADWGFTD